MLKGIKLRLYPNRTQQNQLEQMFGNDRFVWNQMLAMMNERYQNNKLCLFRQVQAEFICLSRLKKNILF
ncbi:transposase [Lactobacillus helveticus R0052]|nr:transposase [Lactobacillus helveticus R0052]